MNKKYLITMLVTLLAFGSFADVVSRNETVYVKLDAYGRPEVKEVVTYLKTDGNGASEKINLTEVKNVVGLEQPVLDGSGNHQFNTTSTDIFYSGMSSERLPVDIKIKYFLNGEEVPFASLDGKSGKIRIEVKFINQVSKKMAVSYKEVGTGTRKDFFTDVYVPFLTMATTSFDILNYRNIKAPDGTVAVVGNKMKLSWLTQPLPEASFYIEAESDHIIMPSITFQIVPKMIPLPEVDLYSSLTKIYQGIDQIESYLVLLSAGASKLKDGQAQLTQGLDQIENGADMLKQATDAQKKMTEGVHNIESGIKDGIQDKLWMAKMKELDELLNVSIAILNLVINGGPIPQNVKDFFLAHGIDVPEISSFPGLVDSSEGLSSIQNGAASAADGSAQLQEGVAVLRDSLEKLQAEGTEEIKAGIIDGSSELMRMFAVIREGKKLASQYISFCGYNGEAESRVQFILKTPGAFSM
ncbi:MAG: hypothetical protein JXR63_09765 [Spirochaetales bacterium]|nr:hypothetical protein [Spirochaetales bacterium]